MYEIRPETVKTFILDRNIKLPRFQRSQTWNDKKNFELCISLFKEYPLGVTIVNVEEKDGISVRWLLDGRQRRNALVQMYEDPEKIYYWAKSYIGFDNKDQPDEIEDKFWNKVNEYIECDEEEVDKEDKNSALNEEQLENFDTESDDSNEDSSENNDIESASGLEFLLELIKIIHNKKKDTTGFTKPFDIRKFADKISFVEIDQGNGKHTLSAKKLKRAFHDYVLFCNDEGLDDNNQDSFYAFIDSRSIINDKNGLRKHIEKNWNGIQRRRKIVDRLDNILSNSKIGIIEVKEIMFSDSQKIFNIINTKGTPLSAVEVLSAKPSWNTKIELSTDKTKECVQILYKRLGISSSEMVKWDLPAVLLRRIGKNIVIKELEMTDSNLSKEMTYGFKLLAGIYSNGIRKEDIDKLSKNSGVKWWQHYDQFVNDIQSMLKLINSFTYFKFLNSWRITMMELTSDSIAFDFIILAFKDWERKGKPLGSDTNTKKFEKNCFILWDKLIYEYVTSQWKGSSDSKIAANIAELSTVGDLFQQISSEDWVRLLEEIRDKYTVGGVKVDQRNMRPLLYHFYCFSSISGPDTQFNIDVDHIIPQTLFDSSTIKNKDQVKNSIFNLGLLPKSENCSKNAKRLIEITDTWLIDQIKRHELVEKEDFQKYSDINNYSEIYNERFSIFERAFTEYRNSLMNN